MKDRAAELEAMLACQLYEAAMTARTLAYAFVLVILWATSATAQQFPR